MASPIPSETRVTEAGGWCWQEAHLTDGHKISGMRVIGWTVEDPAGRIVQQQHAPGWTLTDALEHWQRTKPATENPQ